MTAFLVSVLLLSRSYVCSQAAAVEQRTLTREAVLDLLSCENGFLVSKVPGIFANALSVL